MSPSKQRDPSPKSSPEAKSSEPTKKLKGADARRQFILEEVRRHGSVTYKDIEEAGAQRGFFVGYQSHKDDDDFFARYALEPRLVPGKGMFVLRDREVGWTFKFRLEENRDQKKQIGRFAAALLIGSPIDWDTTLPEKFSDPLEQLQACAWRQLVSDENKNYKAAEVVRDMLKEFWQKRHRIAAIDAGTTTYAAAEFVANPWGIESEDNTLPHAGVLSPTFDPREITLRMLTNCSRIERCMESPRCFPDVISSGGSLRKDTLARTGVLAEQSLAAMNIHPDIAMLGTTSLRTDRRYKTPGFACDSEEEARTKRILLDADLRCILMDSNKMERLRSSAFTFAVCSSKFVDLVITDSKINPKLVKQFWDAGVALLTASEIPESPR